MNVESTDSTAIIGKTHNATKAGIQGYGYDLAYGVYASSEAGTALYAKSGSPTALAALLDGNVQISGTLTVNGQTVNGGSNVLRKAKFAGPLAPNGTAEFNKDALFNGNNYTLTSFKAYSTPSGTYNATWTPAPADISYTECSATGEPVFKLTVKNNSTTDTKKYRVVYTYTTAIEPCLPDNTPPTATLAPTAAAGPYINADEQTAGFPVVASLTTNASPASPAVAGDTFELLLGGAAFPTPLTRVLTAADITTGSYNFTIAAGQLGAAEGFKLITSRVTDIAHNVGAVSLALSLTLDTIAPTACAITTPATDGITITAAPYTVWMSGSPAGTGGVTKVDFNVNGTLYATTTVYPYGIYWTPAANGTNIPLTAKCYDDAGNYLLSPVRTINVNIAPTLCPDASLTCSGAKPQCCTPSQGNNCAYSCQASSYNCHQPCGGN